MARYTATFEAASFIGWDDLDDTSVEATDTADLGLKLNTDLRSIFALLGPGCTAEASIPDTSGRHHNVKLFREW